jgi:hypothetical protein
LSDLTGHWRFGFRKTVDRFLVNHLAKGLAGDYVYFQEGLVSTVDSVVDQLFAMLNAPDEVEQVFTMWRND